MKVKVPVVAAAFVLGLVAVVALMVWPSTPGPTITVATTSEPAPPFVHVEHDPPTFTPTTTTAAPKPKAKQRAPRVYGGVDVAGHACGGDLPPCWVMMRESGGNPNAYNPTGCSGNGCFGKWQCDPNTCDGTGTEEEQDAEARRVWDNGRGCQHWNACG